MPPPREDAWTRLVRLVDEAMVLQDSSEILLAEIRENGALHEMARRGGPMIRRFTALREELPGGVDPALRRHTEPLDAILAHHAMVLSSSLELLAVAWRSERMAAELRRIRGLGRPGERLAAVKAELDAEAWSPPRRA